MLCNPLVFLKSFCEWIDYVTKIQAGKIIINGFVGFEGESESNGDDVAEVEQSAGKTTSNKTNSSQTILILPGIQQMQKPEVL